MGIGRRSPSSEPLVPTRPAGRPHPSARSPSSREMLANDADDERVLDGRRRVAALARSSIAGRASTGRSWTRDELYEDRGRRRFSTPTSSSTRSTPPNRSQGPGPWRCSKTRRWTSSSAPTS